MLWLMNFNTGLKNCHRNAWISQVDSQMLTDQTTMPTQSKQQPIQWRHSVSYKLKKKFKQSPYLSCKIIANIFGTKWVSIRSILWNVS